MGVTKWVASYQSINKFPPLFSVLLGGLQYGRKFRIQFGNYFFGIANNRDIGKSNLSDFGWIDINVNNFCTRRKAFHIAGYAVIKARTKGNKQVCFLQSGDRRNGSVHAWHAKVLLVRIWECATCHKCGHNRSANNFCKFQKFFVSTSSDNTAANVKHRLL
ncbi:unannotated protein [freshwater metagenome]|uniref:Unannotated protein n=1 Tax=freshwater metagenome TaxID=449393 RepID=A0A6J6DDZ0_9ZZZZ